MTLHQCLKCGNYHFLLAPIFFIMLSIWAISGTCDTRFNRRNQVLSSFWAWCLPLLVQHCLASVSSCFAVHSCLESEILFNMDNNFPFGFCTSHLFQHSWVNHLWHLLIQLSHLSGTNLDNELPIKSNLRKYLLVHVASLEKSLDASHLFHHLMQDEN